MGSGPRFRWLGGGTIIDGRQTQNFGANEDSCGAHGVGRRRSCVLARNCAALVEAVRYSPSMKRRMRWARPVAPSQVMRVAHSFGLPLAASNLPGMPVRKRARTSSFSTPMTES